MTSPSHTELASGTSESAQATAFTMTLSFTDLSFSVRVSLNTSQFQSLIHINLDGKVKMWQLLLRLCKAGAE